MIVSISHDNESVLNPKDEKKLLAVENKKNIIYSTKSKYNNIGVLSCFNGKILLFDDTYQGGIISYNGYNGGLPYTRYYQLASLINSNINNILILGLGSGSTVIDCLKIYDIDCLDAIEIDFKVIDVAQKYFDLPEDKRIKLHCTDAINFITNVNKKYDLIIVDLFLAGGLPVQFMSVAFVKMISKILTDDGIVGVNLFGSENLNNEVSEIFKLEYKIYNSFFPAVYAFPVLYGAYEFYRHCCDLRYKMSNITNIVLLATNKTEKLSKIEFINKAKIMQTNSCETFLKYFPMYARDYFDKEILTDNLTSIDDALLKRIYSY